jgi:hypothetical protein
MVDTERILNEHSTTTGMDCKINMDESELLMDKRV